MVATFLYDCTRFPCLALGVWNDFIPNIGKLLLNCPECSPLVGYIYRYLGDGGGMGLAFFMVAPWVAGRCDVKKAAVVYGILVWGCLMVTLAGSPEPEKLLFKLTPFTFTMSLIGHLVYGGILGLEIARSETSRANRRLAHVGRGTI
jgi:hypothetical protein